MLPDVLGNLICYLGVSLDALRANSSPKSNTAPRSVPMVKHVGRRRPPTVREVGARRPPHVGPREHESGHTNCNHQAGPRVRKISVEVAFSGVGGGNREPTRTIDVHPGETVSELKNLLKQEVDKPVEKMHLTYQGTEMENTKTIESYADRDKIKVICSVRG